MKTDLRAQRLLDMLSLNAGPATLAARRSGFAALMAMGSRPQDIADVRDLRAGEHLDLRLYSTGRPRPRAALVFFHGGGLVAGSIETHDGICRALCVSSGAAVISVAYRLAPEHKFPAALEDAGFAVDWVADHAEQLGIDANRIAIGGESAGAILATLVSQGYQMVNVSFKAQLLLCPVIDLVGETPSRREFASGFLIDQEIVAQDIAHCLPSGMTAADLPSSFRNTRERLPPPTIIVAAECDPFRDEALLYADMLRHSGVQVRYNCHAGMFHSFYGLPALLPQADVCLIDAGRQLAELLG